MYSTNVTLPGKDPPLRGPGGTARGGSASGGKASSRREFCRRCAVSALAGLGAAGSVHAGLLDRFFTGGGEKQVLQNDAPKALWQWSREASHYIDLGKNLECQLCPNACKMEPESRSRCRVRVHKNGKLHTLVYGNPAAVHVDPIEKKPLYHFHPSSDALSLGFAGCNLGCLNCQNWELSQSKPEELERYELFPGDAAKRAAGENCLSIAYTYNEPSVVFEYMLDTAREARSRGIRNVWVTNGYINEKPLLELCAVLDGANVDLKSFSEDVYAKLNFGKLEPVLDTLRILREKKVWFEITCLMVPTYSDDPAMIRKMCRWIAKDLGPDVPVHFTRFAPQYKLEHLPPTPPLRLLEARQTAMEEGLRYPYIGNWRTPDGAGANTACHKCGEALMERIGFMVTKSKMLEGKCVNCGTEVAGRWGG